MLFRKYFFLIFLFFASIFLYGCEKGNENVVARIGDNYTVTFEELRKYVYDWLYIKKFRDQTDAYNNALNDLITNQLKRFDFFDRGLQNDKELLKTIMRFINEELVIEFFETQFLDKYVNDSAIEATYNRMNKEVTYRQIVLMKPESAFPEQLDSLREKLNLIRTEVEGGKDFSQLVAEYSQDIKTARVQGLKPSINWENSITNPVDDIAFKLNVGDIRSIETNDALYIIQVTQINEVNNKSFEEEKDNIRLKLRDVYMEQSLGEFEKFKKSLVDENHVNWNQKALEQITKWSAIPGFFTNKYQDIINDEINKNNNLTILKYSEKNVDYKELIYLLENILTIKTLSQYKIKDIQDFLLEAIRTNMLVQNARDLGLEKNIFHSETKNPVLRSRIVGLYNTAVIDSQIPERTEESLRKFYNDHKDSTFYQLEKVNIYTLIANNKEKIESYKQKLNEGIPFEKLEDRISVKTFIRNRDGVIKTFLGNEKPYLGEAAIRLTLNEIDGPVEYYDIDKGMMQYAIIKCVGKVEEKQLTYEEVQDKIEEVFVDYYREKIDQSVRQELYRKYPVEIYKDVLAEKISFLGKNE